MESFLILSRLQSGTEEVVRLDDALAAIAAEREASSAGLMAWLPIETAPKDGTKLLVFDGGKITTAYWDGDSWELVVPSEGYRDSDTVYAKFWMPLPEAPNVEVTGSPDLSARRD